MNTLRASKDRLEAANSIAGAENMHKTFHKYSMVEKRFRMS
jgi:hypothetical protein